jgi:hypothetical protein
MICRAKAAVMPGVSLTPGCMTAAPTPTQAATTTAQQQHNNSKNSNHDKNSSNTTMKQEMTVK